MYGIRVALAEGLPTFAHPDTIPAGNTRKIYEVQ